VPKTEAFRRRKLVYAQAKKAENRWCCSIVRFCKGVWLSLAVASAVTPQGLASGCGGTVSAYGECLYASAESNQATNEVAYVHKKQYLFMRTT
jgi:hypothetical protein